MFKRILIATDGSSLSYTAIEKGVSIAKMSGAEVIGVHVRPFRRPVHYGGTVLMLSPALEAALEQQSARDDERYLADIARTALDVGVPYTAAHPRADTPAEGILEVAANRSCDLIVMATHGRHGLSRVLAGSEASKVVTQAHVPVLVTH